MYYFSTLLFLAGLCEITQQAQIFNHNVYKENNHRAAYHRIVQLMRSYYEEAAVRVARLNPIRFMYEESPYYEMGYITGEIIERYRKVVENAQKPFRFKFYTLFDIMKHVELVQKLYFELYHLVRMIHETPRKWRKVPEFVNIEKITGPELLYGQGGVDGKGKQLVPLDPNQLTEINAIQDALMAQQRNREKEKKRQRKKFAKLRDAFLHGMVNNMKGEKKPYNQYWPKDYGWEIHYFW